MKIQIGPKLGVRDLTMISQSERERERYESHLKLERDIYTALAKREEAGEAWPGKGPCRGPRSAASGAVSDDIRYFQELLGRGVMPLEQLRVMPCLSSKTLRPDCVPSSRPGWRTVPERDRGRTTRWPSRWHDANRSALSASTFPCFPRLRHRSHETTTDAPQSDGE